MLHWPLLSLVTATLVFAVQVSGQDPEYVIPPEMVQVVVENAGEIPMLLKRRESKGSVVDVCSIPAGERTTLSLESGFYYLETSDSLPRKYDFWITIPVPAWAPAMKPRLKDGLDQLAIPVGDRIEPREGMSWIPPGPAVLGDTLGVGQPDERPARIVVVPGFWMGQTEVTNEQYVEFLNDTREFGRDWIDLENRTCRIQKSGDGFVTDAPALPVVTVTWAGAWAWCEWKSKKAGKRYRLPTEEEWEKAARGPESWVYAYGNVYRPNAANQESGQPLPVKSFSANSFQLYDMTGNVFEWVTPSPLRIKENEGSPFTHVLRGGSFVLDGMYLRNSFRMKQSPTVMTDDIGFRFAMDDLAGESK